MRFKDIAWKDLGVKEEAPEKISAISHAAS